MQELQLQVDASKVKRILCEGMGTGFKAMKVIA